MKKLGITSALFMALLMCESAQANTYHAEVEASAGFVDPNHGSSGSEYAVHGKYFFKPVETRDAPLAESAFLDRASNISVQGHFSDRGRTKENAYGAELEIFVPNSDLYVSAGIKQNEEDETIHGIKHSSNTTYYNVEAGYLIVPNLLVSAGIEGFNNDNKNGVDPILRAKYVTQVAGKDVNLEGNIAFGDLDEYHIAADYYVNKKLSVGADYYKNNIDQVSEYGVKARKFFTHQFSLEGRVGFGKEFDNDYNSFDLTMRYHF